MSDQREPFYLWDQQLCQHGARHRECEQCARDNIEWFIGKVFWYALVVVVASAAGWVLG